MSEELENKATTPEFFIQVGGAAGGTVTPQMSMEEFVAGSKAHFQEIADVIEAAGQSFVDRIAKIASKPTECSIEFGVNAGAEASVPFITKGTIGANFKVTIKWQTKEG